MYCGGVFVALVQSLFSPLPVDVQLVQLVLLLAGGYVVRVQSMVAGTSFVSAFW